MGSLIDWYENFKFKRALKRTISYAILCRKRFISISYEGNERTKQPANSYSLNNQFEPILPRDNTKIEYFIFKNISTGQVELYGNPDNRGRFKLATIISGSEVFNEAILDQMYSAHERLFQHPLSLLVSLNNAVR